MVNQGKIKLDDPASLTDFKMLSFDVYSTLVDEKGGMFSGLQTLLKRLPEPNPYIDDRKYTLAAFQKFESHLQVTQPNLQYKELLPLAYSAFASSLDLPQPSEEEARHFGTLAGEWPAFPDTVSALQILKKHYKLVLLSNIDIESISRTIFGPLEGFEFDAVYTAQEIGSYKPSLNNFHFLLGKAKKDLGIEKAQILHTAQSLTADHVPAKTMEMTSVWIDRDNEEDVLEKLRDKVDFTWRFETLGEMAAAVEEAFRE
ncbi:hypothetical protein B7463_g306, partial [Scytalidium lignicola]